ncbi:MAG TPA: cytochrome d ubiquinol oxidase subunit II, partial [Acidimicrobiia bacterium]
MDLVTIWFILIAVLWIGYFVLDGFDLGVGVLMPFIGKDDLRRRVMVNTIGPVWDGNEVWLLVAGGATFAAFPLWYATMFSGYYLALFVLLIALIMRGVAFEYRGKRDSQAWRDRWDKAIFVGSAVPALLFGVAFGNVVGGSPIAPLEGTTADNASNLNYVGNFFDLLNPYALL